MQLQPPSPARLLARIMARNCALLSPPALWHANSMDHFLIILSILAVHLGAVASPGPNFLIVSHNALAGSREAGLATARGITTVAVLYIGGGMLGFAAIVARSPLVFTVVKLLGAAYLIGMGLRTLFTVFS